MAQIRPEHRKRNTALRVLLATASVATLLCAPLHAQEIGLRGPVGEDDLNNTLLLHKRRPTAEPEQAQAPTYQPVSPGAIPTQADAEATDLFSEPPNAENATGSSSSSARPPTTARQRARELRARQAGTTTPSAAETPATPVTDEELTTGTVRQGTVDSETEIENGPESERQRAIEGRRPQPDADPFEPTGIRFGTFVLKPSLEQGITATSNADSSSGGKSAVLSETTLRLNAASDWENHSATIDAYGNYRKSISGQEVKDLSGGIDGRLQLDFADDLRALARLGYSMRPESTSSPVVISGTAERPTLHTLSGALGVEKDVGKLRFGITGEVVDESYSDAELTDGTTLSQKDRDSRLYTGKVRVGYEVSPAFTPFGEVEFGRRVYDLRFDTAGFERSSKRTGARAGVEIDLGEKFGGEISAGWISEDFDDDRLKTVSAATIAADLKWSPMRGTIVGLTGETLVEGSTTAGDSGSVLYNGRLSVERQIRSNLTAFLAGGVGYRDYASSNDHELRLSAEAGLTWWLNRYAGLTGKLRHETFDSTLSNRDAKTNSVFVGLKIQR
ncbi:outer membrane beta-barrel protein [Aminobacter carboxidus]|uniref:Outer membrane beta-barrel protein n=1 Tax=Aminobacter carboxidus TaxID=376165 RepID=A0ABR9GWG2_9HYPH|nr:outer membrane beta-barrel protein [Aminobacter carboxidus]MBE1208015.1 outer membrane beta-barrel protein [Aminobacter carboxidus]